MAKFQIKDGDKWINVSKGERLLKLGRRFLRYELKEDGSTTIGCASPGNWRERPICTCDKPQLRCEIHDTEFADGEL